jgi:hypothetical protein
MPIADSPVDLRISRLSNLEGLASLRIESTPIFLRVATKIQTLGFNSKAAAYSPPSEHGTSRRVSFVATSKTALGLGRAINL